MIKRIFGAISRKSFFYAIKVPQNSISVPDFGRSVLEGLRGGEK